MEPSDEALIEAVNRGPPDDRAAFERLYERHRGFVYRVAMRFADGPEAAADAMQEAFVAFYGKFPGFVLQGRATTYLYAVARNCALQQVRKGRKSRLNAEDAGDSRGFERGSAGWPTGYAELRAAVRDLPEPQREVLILRVVDGMSVGEVALALGIPTGTVKSRLHAALTALRSDPRTRDYFESGEEMSEIQ